MLKLTRKTQQGVVVTPKGQSDLTPLVIRVVDIVPGTVGLGFDGEDYEIVRSEIYNGGIDTYDYKPKPNLITSPNFIQNRMIVTKQLPHHGAK